MTTIILSEAVLRNCAEEFGMVKTTEGYALTEVTDAGMCPACDHEDWSATLLRPITIKWATDEECDWNEVDGLVCAECGSENVYEDEADYAEAIEDERAEIASERAMEARRGY